MAPGFSFNGFIEMYFTNHTTHPLKGRKSEVFSICTRLCNYLIPEHFITGKETPYPLAATPHFLLPSPLAITHLFSVSVDRPALDVSCEHGVVQTRHTGPHGPFCDWLLSLSGTFSRFIHVAARGSPQSSDGPVMLR